MRFGLTVLLALALVSLGLVAQGASEDPKSAMLGFIPSENPEVLTKHGVELAKALQGTLGVPINIYVSKNYTGLVDALKDKKVDFAFLTAATFVFAEKVTEVKPLLKKVWKGPFYWSAIIATKSSGFKTLENLKGKRMGFVDEKSASGYLYPRAHMIKRKLNPDKFFKEVKFLGNHEAAIKALLAGQVDAVAVYADDSKGKTGAWDQYAPEQAKQIRVIWLSDPIPNDPFVVRKDFYEKYPRFSHDLMFALLDMGDAADNKNLLKTLLGVESLQTATTKQYDPVRDLVKFLNLKLQ